MRERAGRRQITRKLAPKMETGGRRVEKERVSVVDTQTAEAEALVARLATNYAQTVNHYMEFLKGDGQTRSERFLQAHTKAEEYRKFREEQAKETPPRNVEWEHLNALAATDINQALDLWGRISDAAYEEVVSGFRAAEVVGEVSPFQRAQFLALREHFTEGWNPQNGIERTLIDMLAQTYSLYLHWTKLSHERAVSIVENQSNWRREAMKVGWLPPSQEVSEAVEQGYKLADGYHRQFMRTLRQLRDMRRYKLVIQNPGQVNIGGQQVNVAQTT